MFWHPCDDTLTVLSKSGCELFGGYRTGGKSSKWRKLAVESLGYGYTNSRGEGGVFSVKSNVIFLLNNELYSGLSMITCRVRSEIICGGWLLLDSVLVLATASTFLVRAIPRT
jgi:hypothetical protein